MEGFSSGICPAVGRGEVVNFEAEQAADDVLTQIGMSPAYPVDLEKVALRLDAKIVEEPIDGDGYLLELPDGTYEVVVPDDAQNASRGHRTRVRFTIAHELGHHYLNGVAREVESAADDPELDHISIEEVPQEEVEQWCDRFASAILMPEGAVRDYVGSADRLSDTDHVREGAHEFDVSYSAWAYRLAGLYDLSVCRLSSSEPVRIAGLPPRIRDAESAEARVRRAMEDALDSDRTAGPYVGAVPVRLGEERSQVLGLVTGKN